MIVELSNQELIDIYSCIGCGVLSNSETINKLKDSATGIEILTNKLEEENKRLQLLMSKTFKLIDWRNN